MNNAMLAKNIQVELVKLLYQQLPFALWAESCAALGLLFALWPVQDHVLLIGWLIGNLLFCGFARHLLVRGFKQVTVHSPLTWDNMHPWLLLFSLGALISGVSWGVAGSLLIVNNDLMRQTFVVFLLIGVTAAANPFYSPVRSVYALFLIPAFMPLAFWLLAQGGVFLILGLLAFLYILIMLATSSYSHRLIETSLLLRFENTDLLDHLSTAMSALERRSQETERSLSLVRATLESTTDGILVVDSANKVIDYNQKFLEMWKLPSPIRDMKQANHEMMGYIKDQLVNAHEVLQIASTQELESFDEILLKDGRVFERYSQAQRVGENYVGRVWSFRDVTNRKKMEEKLYHQANYDSLTGLPNRALAQDRISQAIFFAKRTKLDIAVMFLDVDRFKLINDTLSHSHGDLLLKEIAQRLKNCVRENDTVSREGGDEFLIVVTSLKSENDAIAVARKCLEMIAEPFVIAGNKFNVSISLGICFYPRDGENPETLIRNADIAMYRAKEMGRNNFQFFTEDMNKRVQTRLTLERQMHSAMDSDEFSLDYQPIVNLATRQVVGVEALLRWNHRHLGLIPPDEFIPVAEESGMILAIGAWALRTACLQAKQWEKLGIEPILLSVNISARQFKQVNFLEQIHEILGETGLNPKYLAVEITESIIMDEVEKNIVLLNKLKQLGVLIVIDDFGTGYSSLNYLKQLPVDKLKIDKTFIQDIPIHADDAAITCAIIALAAQLNIRVIAEGVINESQYLFLLENKCAEAQGFYLYKPLSVNDCTQLLKDQRAMKD